MRKILIAFLALCACSQAVAAPLFFWRAEGTTLDGTHDFTGGDTTVTFNSAALDGAAARVGSNGVYIDDSFSYGTFAVSSSDIADSEEGAIGFSVQFVSSLSGVHLIALQGSGNDYIAVRRSNTDEVSLRYRNGTIGYDVTIETTDVNLTTGVWYGIVARWNRTAGDLRLEVYDAAGDPEGTPVENLSAGITSGAPAITSLDIGDWYGDGHGAYYDNIFVADTYSEPLEDNLVITSYTEYGGGGGGGSTVPIIMQLQ